ncbi:MAG: hypothetical protein ACRDYZ_08540, partial [Acidimicrobiales bacterium]
YSDVPAPPPPPGFESFGDVPSPPAPPPPGFATTGHVDAPPAAPAGFDSFEDVGAPPPPPAGFATAPTPTVAGGEHDVEEVPITPDFFARAGRRR